MRDTAYLRTYRFDEKLSERHRDEATVALIHHSDDKARLMRKVPRLSRERERHGPHRKLRIANIRRKREEIVFPITKRRTNDQLRQQSHEEVFRAERNDAPMADSSK